MIEFADVTVHRGGRSVLEGISGHFPLNTVTALLGPSGSGKSTLLRLVNALLPTTSGTVRVNGVALPDWSLHSLRKSIGFVPQDLGLFPHWTVRRQVERFTVPGQTADSLLKQVGLSSDLAERYPRQLSGGQRQRVALARALAGSPSILLLDEPFSALDPALRRELQDLVLRLPQTIILVTHDWREARRVARNVWFLDAGRAVFQGSVADFERNSAPATRAFLEASA
jgi:osmoprotectant transport system ATP-binding protein